jgi:hypothetical protein
MIISPAKTIDTLPCHDRLKDKWTVPNCNEGKTKAIAEAMKLQSQKELERLLGVSSNLAKTSHEVCRQTPSTLLQSRQRCELSFCVNDSRKLIFSIGLRWIGT